MDTQGKKDEPDSDGEFPSLDLSVIIQPLLDQGHSLKEIAVALRKTAYLAEMMARINGDIQ